MGLRCPPAHRSPHLWGAVLVGEPLRETPMSPPLIAVALPGDMVLCPECREPLLLFTTPTFAGVEVQTGGEQVRGSSGRYRLYCRLCGSGSVLHARLGATTHIEDAIGPRVLVRSGSWVGWRALGGE